MPTEHGSVITLPIRSPDNVHHLPNTRKDGRPALMIVSTHPAWSSPSPEDPPPLAA